MIKFVDAQSNKWIQPVRKRYLMMCCDCGLVHELDFRIDKKHIQFRARRNERVTKVARRHR